MVRSRFRAVLGTAAAGALCVTSSSSSAEAPLPIPDRLGLHVHAGSPREPTLAPSGLPVVLLHGICGEPVNSCSVFAGASGAPLVCARADLACPKGGAMWSGGSGALLRIDRAFQRAAEESRGNIDPHAPRALVGFSQGAYVAMRALKATPRRYPAVLLIGAFVKPTRAELELAGVKRIALAAGDFDGSAATMRESAARLRTEGFDARYVSLGRVGHTYVADDPQKLATALAWIREVTDQSSASLSRP